MKTLRYSAGSAALAGLSLGLGIALLALPTVVHAQPSRPAMVLTEAQKPEPARIDEPQATGATDAACERVRRRLWVEGEGWVVRRVANCR